MLFPAGHDARERRFSAGQGAFSRKLPAAFGRAELSMAEKAPPGWAFEAADTAAESDLREKLDEFGGILRDSGKFPSK